MKWLACFAAGAVTCGALQAQTLTGTLLEVQPGLTTSGTFSGGSYSNYKTGLMVFDSFDAFCIEPSATILQGDTVIYQIQDAKTLGAYDSIGRVLGGFLASDQSNQHAAAAQWAIWELIIESGSPYTLAAGKVQVASGAVRDLANSYLTNLQSYQFVDFQVLHNDKKQNMITVIPEPGTALLMAFSTFALTLRRRRR